MDLTNFNSQLELIKIKCTISDTDSALCENKKSNPLKVTKKKKKKKVKSKAENEDNPTKSDDKKSAIEFESVPDAESVDTIDSNEPTKIRFRKYTIEDFKLISLLGEGAFGKVYLSKLQKHNAFFAIKFMKKKQIFDDNDYQSVLMEKKVMIYGNQNPFICKLFCSFQTSDFLCFAMEYCCGGDLKYHLYKEKRFKESVARFYLSEILCSICYLHKLGIIYRDLKLDNIMITKTGHIKLVDFGLCQGKIYRQEMMPSDFCGTIEYMAPEVIKANKYNQSVDYWSLGIVAYEMAVGIYPFTGTDEDEICWSICHQNVSFPGLLSPEYQNFISLLLIKNSDERLGMPNSPHCKITKHPFFVDVNWDDVENCRLIPSYIPNTKSSRDTSHFADYFTGRKLSPKADACPGSDNSNLFNDYFNEFDYTNPNMTD